LRDLEHSWRYTVALSSRLTLSISSTTKSYRYEPKKKKKKKKEEEEKRSKERSGKGKRMREPQGAVGVETNNATMPPQALLERLKDYGFTRYFQL
jgi:hypothetical protein